MKSRLPVKYRLTRLTWVKACFTGPIRPGCSEGAVSFGSGNASLRNWACTELDRIGGARKKRGNQKPRATLRREIRAAQEFLGAWPGGQTKAKTVAWSTSVDGLISVEVGQFG
jgi:hypothetical protein